MLLELFLVPILSSSRLVTLVRFFSRHADGLVESLTADAKGSEATRTGILAAKIGACSLLALMYGSLKKELVHSEASEVVKTIYPVLKAKGLTKGDKFTGKELSQFLVQKLSSTRADLVDGSRELKELYRKYQCAAYNAIMAVITCIQDQEKFYTNYIFKENVTKSEMIWTRDGVN